MGAYSSKMYNPSDATAAEINNMALSTNVVLIPYSIILQEKRSNNEKPICCNGCGAALNMFSKLYSSEEYAEKKEKEPVDDEQRAEEENKTEENDKKSAKGRYLDEVKSDEVVWICEFCDIHNRLAKDTRLPENEKELYLVKKAETTTTVTNETETVEEEVVESKDETSLIFCIDISGSMSDWHQVEKNGQKQQAQRLKLVTEAVLKQLEEMKKTHPHRKVGVVLFESGVTLLGDCTSGVPHKLTYQTRTFDAILNECLEKGESLVTLPLSESYHKLDSVIKTLAPRGGTDLGEGLLGGLGLAMQGKTGSRIILCTDGQASVQHLGDTTKPFYDKVGDIATQKGISVSVITVKGQACQVDALGPLTDRTAGQIIRVDPANFDLASLAANNLIATNVRLRAIMHEGLAFKNEDASNLKNNDSILNKNVGSVSINNEAYFEYRVKSVEELQKGEINLEDLEFLPLQAQIFYTDLEGNEYVLVVSRRQELTKDHKEVEKGMKTDILAGYVQKQSANLVLDGKVEEAKKANEMWSQHMEKMANNEDIDAENKKALQDFKVQNQQLQELMNKNGNHNAVERDEITSKLYEIKQQKQSKF